MLVLWKIMTISALPANVKFSDKKIGILVEKVEGGREENICVWWKNF